METDSDPTWQNATWEGSRRAQIRVALGLTLRERLLALDDLIELSRRLAQMPKKADSRDSGPR